MQKRSAQKSETVWQTFTDILRMFAETSERLLSVDAEH